MQNDGATGNQSLFFIIRRNTDIPPGQHFVYMIPDFQIHIQIDVAIFRNDFFGNIAPGRSQTAAGNDNICTFNSDIQYFFHAGRIISHRCLVQDIETALI